MELTNVMMITDDKWNTSFKFKVSENKIKVLIHSLRELDQINSNENNYLNERIYLKPRRLEVTSQLSI